jgi:nucleoside-diphosphate-sugar epimerase
MKALVTGGNGFIGSQLAESLIEKGESVTLLDQKFNSNTNSLTCRKVKGDVRNYGTVKKAVRDAEVIFHLAAVSRVITGQEEPCKCLQTNILGTVNVLEACRKLGNDRLVFYGSSREVYGDSQSVLVKENHPKSPKSIYGASKLSAELACLQYRRAFETKTVILRFSNVYGSERDLMDRVTPKFVIKAMKDDDIVLYGGDQVLDFNFIDDTVSGIVLAYQKTLELEMQTLGEDFHLVSGKGTSIKELANMVVKLCDSSSKIVRKESRKFEIENFVGDPAKADRILGYKARIPMEKGLQILKDRLAKRF